MGGRSPPMTRSMRYNIPQFQVATLFFAFGPTTIQAEFDSFKAVDWQAILDDIVREIQPHLTKGKVASYIPALAEVRQDQFGIAFTTIHGETFKAGDADTPFSIQFIFKVFALVMALDIEDQDLWKRVGREPSGSAFNSIVQLESEHGRPRNPFINAGAIVVTDTIVQHCGEEAAIDKILRFLQTCAQEQEGIIVDSRVTDSEEARGDRNRALLAYFMRSYGIVRSDVPSMLGAYFDQCAIEATVTSHDHVDRVNDIMMICGHYDMSGDFAFRVGLAGKSGVGGGIMAVISEVGTLTVWSPGLNEAGISLAGTLAMEWFSKRTGVNLF